MNARLLSRPACLEPLIAPALGPEGSRSGLHLWSRVSLLPWKASVVVVVAELKGVHRAPGRTPVIPVGVEKDLPGVGDRFGDDSVWPFGEGVQLAGQNCLSFDDSSAEVVDHPCGGDCIDPEDQQLGVRKPVKPDGVGERWPLARRAVTTDDAAAFSADVADGPTMAANRVGEPGIVLVDPSPSLCVHEKPPDRGAQGAKRIECL